MCIQVALDDPLVAFSKPMLLVITDNERGAIKKSSSMRRLKIERACLCNSWVSTLCGTYAFAYNMTALSKIIKNAKSKFGNPVFLKYLRFDVGLVGLSND